MTVNCANAKYVSTFGILGPLLLPNTEMFLSQYIKTCLFTFKASIAAVLYVGIYGGVPLSLYISIVSLTLASLRNASLL